MSALLKPRPMLPGAGRCRIVKSITKVSLQPSGPWTKTRLSPVQQKGKRYEKKAGEYLKLLSPGDWYAAQWLYFTADGNSGWAQPDLFRVDANRVFCFEFKLTQHDEGERQLEHLYGPLLSHLYSLPVTRTLVFCNILRPVPLAKDFKDLSPNGVNYWHYWSL